MCYQLASIFSMILILSSSQDIPSYKTRFHSTEPHFHFPEILPHSCDSESELILPRIPIQALFCIASPKFSGFQDGALSVNHFTIVSR